MNDNKIIKVLNNHKIQLRYAILFTLAICFSIQMDGYFPFLNQPSIQIQTISVTLKAVMLVLAFKVFLWPPQYIIGWFARVRVKFNQLVILSVSTLVILAYALWLYQARTTSFFVIKPIIIFPLLLFVPSIILILKKRYVGLFLITAAMMLVPIVCAPITAKQYDLMPIIDAQLDAFIKGDKFYQYYLLDNGSWTQAVRQPGTTLSYLPAKLLGIDLRIMNIFYISALAGLLWRWNAEKGGSRVGYLTTITFTLLPYRIFRHDLYETFFWLLLTVSIYLLTQKKLGYFAISWAVAIFTQTWAWLFTPFVAVYIAKKHGMANAVKVVMGSLSLAGLLMSYFVLQDPYAYYHHVFEYYRQLVEYGIYAQTTIHLTPLLYLLKIPKTYVIWQAFGLSIIGIMSLFKLRTLKSLLTFLIVAMTWFVMFNVLSWNYMYLTVLLLMTIIVINDVHTKPV